MKNCCFIMIDGVQFMKKYIYILGIILVNGESLVHKVETVRY